MTKVLPRKATRESTCFTESRKMYGKRARQESGKLPKDNRARLNCKGKDLTEKVPDLAYRYSHNTTSFEERLKAKVCEVCGCTDSDSYEIHHVNKVKNLKGKADWEKVMLAKRRKTIVVCHKCHMRIHHGTKTE